MTTRSTTLRILLLHQGVDELLGSERCLIDLVEGMTTRGHQCLVACTSPKLAHAVSAVGAEARLVPGWPGSSQSRLPAWSEMRVLRRMVKDFRPSIIHCNTDAPVKVAVSCAIPEKVPVVVHIHMVPESATERWWSWTPLAAMVVGVSRFAIAGFVEDGVPESRLTVIMNAVDPRRLDVSGIAVDAPVPRPGATTVCVLGSLIDRKRPLDAVAAFAAIASRRPDMDLVFLGDGSSEPAVRDAIHAAGLEGRIRLLGRRVDAAAWMASNSSIVLAPAEWEAMPLNVLEAQMAGRCVIASGIPPHREVIEHGVTGFLYPMGDVQALSDLLLSDSTSHSSVGAVGAAGREVARQRYTLSRYLDEFEALYRVLEANGPPALAVADRARLLRRVLTGR